MESEPKDLEFKDILKSLFEDTISATKFTHKIAKILNDDKFLCSNDANTIEKSVDVQAGKIWNLLNTTISLCSPNTRLRKKGDVGDKIKTLTEINDFILEIIHKDIDVAKGIDSKPDLNKAGGNAKKANSRPLFWNKMYATPRQQPDAPSPSLVKASVQGKDPGTVYTLVASSEVVRPQVKYNLKVDNSKAPFVPLKLVNKLHALPSRPPTDQAGPSGTGRAELPIVQAFVNPYHEELEQLKPLPILFTKTKEIKFPGTFRDTPLIFVSTTEHLDQLITDLSRERVIAVDLEHHGYRSYLGLVCLMQISSRYKDYLVDTFALWDHMNRLIEIFANPNILKVFHGASKDIEWLQRDFSLYVVNLFDTFYASEALNLPYKSLAYLLNTYCDFKANKEFQLADWRIRPLPEALINYARSDTHFLIYIYERMKDDILDKEASTRLDPALYPDGLINYVFNKSRRLCQKIYYKPRFGKDFFDNLLKSRNKRFNPNQMYALQNINEWRDSVARAQDESPSYVLPCGPMVTIAEILPKNVSSMLDCCIPNPPLLKQNVHDVYAIIVQALRQKERFSTMMAPGTSSNNWGGCCIVYDNPLHCPHDNRAPNRPGDPEFGAHGGEQAGPSNAPYLPFFPYGGYGSHQAHLFGLGTLEIGFTAMVYHTNLTFFDSSPLFLDQKAINIPCQTDHPNNFDFKAPYEIFLESETLRFTIKAQMEKELVNAAPPKAPSQSAAPCGTKQRRADAFLTGDQSAARSQPSTSAGSPTSKQPPPRLADRISLSCEGGKKRNKLKRVRSFERLARGMVAPIDSYSPPVSSAQLATRGDKNVEPFPYDSVSYDHILKGQPKKSQDNQRNKGQKNRHPEGEGSAFPPQAKKGNPLLAGQKNNRTKSMTFTYNSKP